MCWIISNQIAPQKLHCPAKGNKLETFASPASHPFLPKESNHFEWDLTPGVWDPTNFQPELYNWHTCSPTLKTRIPSWTHTVWIWTHIVKLRYRISCRLHCVRQSNYYKNLSLIWWTPLLGGLTGVASCMSCKPPTSVTVSLEIHGNAFNSTGVVGLVNSEHLPASSVHTCTHPTCWTSEFLRFCTLFEPLSTTMLPLLATTLKSRRLWSNDASKMRETMCDCSGCWFVDNPTTQVMNAPWRSESPGKFDPKKLDQA